MTAIELQKTLAYNPDTGVFTWAIKTGKKSVIGAVAGSTGDKDYTRIRIYRKLYLAHRLAWLYTYGQFPIGEIDHINQVKSDNRISNLRDVSSSQNKQNRTTYVGASGYRGVAWLAANKKWRACIGHNYKNIYIGLFDTAEEASAAYIAKARELHSHTNTGDTNVKS
jgi:hypothetical protein